MTVQIILASGSEIRAALLRNAGVPIEVQKPRVDEEMIRDALLAESATPRDVADALAESKARKIAEKNPEAWVIGCDQVLSFKGKLLSKPEIPTEARAQLASMRGQTHKLLSAVVLYAEGKPVWRHVGEVRMTMHGISDAYLDDYVTRNWDSIRHAVGAVLIGTNIDTNGSCPRLFGNVAQQINGRLLPGIVKAHAVDDSMILNQAEQTRLWVARLR